MSVFFHSQLFAFIHDGQLPLAIRRIKAGAHPDREFHDHNFSEIVVIVSGHPQHLFVGHKYQLSPGDVVVVHPGVIHAYDNANDMELVNVIYDSRKLAIPLLDGRTLPVFRAIFPTAKNTTPSPILHLESQQLKETLQDISALEAELANSAPASMLGALGRFIDLIVHLARYNCEDIRHNSYFFPISSAIDLMNRHFNEPLEVDRLAAVTNMSRRNFFRCFKAAVGCPPHEYQIRIRLQHAAELLQKTTLSVNEIGLRCGFYDGNFFCKKFRDFFATSPGLYRKNQNVKSSVAVRFTANPGKSGEAK